MWEDNIIKGACKSCDTTIDYVKKLIGKNASFPPALLYSLYNVAAEKSNKSKKKVIHSTLNKKRNLCQIIWGMEATV